MRFTRWASGQVAGDLAAADVHDLAGNERQRLEEDDGDSVLRNQRPHALWVRDRQPESDRKTVRCNNDLSSPSIGELPTALSHPDIFILQSFNQIGRAGRDAQDGFQYGEAPDRLRPLVQICALAEASGPGAGSAYLRTLKG